MDKTKSHAIVSCFDKSFDELCELETLITLTKEMCFEQENSSNYYGLSQNKKITLSEERNHYINMLTVALDKVSNIKTLNSLIEKEMTYLQ